MERLVKALDSSHLHFAKKSVVKLVFIDGKLLSCAVFVEIIAVFQALGREDPRPLYTKIFFVFVVAPPVEVVNVRSYTLDGFAVIEH